MVCLRRMNFVQERLAKADTQYSNLVEQLENARDKWLKEKDPASQAKLKTVYDDIMSMVDCTSTRIMHLETGSYGYGNFTLMGHSSSKRVLIPITCLIRCLMLSDLPQARAIQ